MSVKQGPNVRKLISSKMSLLMIPPGKEYGKGEALATGVAALIKPGNIGAVAKEATAWVEAAIAAVKNAPGGEAYGDDEAIAGEILRQVAERKAKK